MKISKKNFSLLKSMGPNSTITHNLWTDGDIHKITSDSCSTPKNTSKKVVSKNKTPFSKIRLSAHRSFGQISEILDLRLSYVRVCTFAYNFWTDGDIYKISTDSCSTAKNTLKKLYLKHIGQKKIFVKNRIFYNFHGGHIFFTIFIRRKSVQNLVEKKSRLEVKSC